MQSVTGILDPKLCNSSAPALEAWSASRRAYANWSAISRDGCTQHFGVHVTSKIPTLGISGAVASADALGWDLLRHLCRGPRRRQFRALVRAGSHSCGSAFGKQPVSLKAGTAWWTRCASETSLERAAIQFSTPPVSTGVVRIDAYLEFFPVEVNRKKALAS